MNNIVRITICFLILFSFLFLFSCSSDNGSSPANSEQIDDDSVGADDDTDDDDASADDDDDDTDDDTGDDTLDDDIADDDSGTEDDDSSVIDDDSGTEDDDSSVIDDDSSDDDTITDCDAVITRQPYLQSVTPDGIRIMWKTDIPGDSVVEYGKTWVPDGIVRENNLKLSHLIELTGLESRTTYYYKVRSCKDETAIARFKTAPLDDSPFSFVGFSDNQTNFDIFSQIAGLMHALRPDLAISSGDIVNSGWDPEAYDREFFGPGRQLFSEAPVYVAIGNHEGNSPFFFESFSFPGDKAYYSFTYGNTFFIALALDTARLYIPGSPQYNFFVQQLSSEQSQNAEFRVVFFHTPPYSEGWPGYDGEPLERIFIVPLMEEYGVDVYFNGHTHDYERGLLNGVTNYIIGGAGGGLDVWARDVPHIVFYESTHHFVHIQVDKKVMTIDAINLDGEIFDSYQIVH